MSENNKDGNKPSQNLTNFDPLTGANPQRQSEDSFNESQDLQESLQTNYEEQKRIEERIDLERAMKESEETSQHRDATSDESQEIGAASALDHSQQHSLNNNPGLTPLRVKHHHNDVSHTQQQEQKMKDDVSKVEKPSDNIWNDFQYNPDSKEQSISNQQKSEPKLDASQIRKIEFQNNQNEPEVIVITFFCYHQGIKKFKNNNCKFWLEIDHLSLQPINGKIINMEKIEEDVLMAKAYFIKKQFTSAYYIDYRYHLLDNFEFKCPSITRYRKQLEQLTTFFDTPDVFSTSYHAYNYYKTDDYPLKRYITLILEKFIQNKFPGDPQMLEQLALFFKTNGYEFYFVEFQVGLLEKLKIQLENQGLSELKAMLQFTLQSLHYVFNAQRPGFQLIGKDNEKTLKDLLDFLAIDLIQEELIQIYEGIFDRPKELALAFEQGLKRFIEWRPEVGIRFLDFSDLFLDVDAFLEKYTNVKKQGSGSTSLEQSISIINKVNVNFNSAAIKKFKEKIKQSMMNSCKNYFELLKIESEVEKEFEHKDILSIYNKLKSSLSENELQNFIKDHFDNLCKHKRLQNIMIEDIKRTAMQSLGLQNHMNFLIKVAKNCPELYTPVFFIQSSQDATLIIRENILTLLTLLAEQQKRSIFFSLSELERLIKNLSESIFKAYQRIIDAFEQSLNLRFFCTKLDLQFLVTNKVDPQLLLKHIDEYAKKYIASIKDQQVFDQIREFQQCKSLQMYPPSHSSIQTHLGFIKIFYNRIIDVMVSSVSSGKLKNAEVFLLQIYDQKQKWRMFSPHSQELSNELFAAIISLESELNENEFWEESIFLTIAQIDFANGWEIEGLSQLRDKVFKLVQKINNLELTFNDALSVTQNYEKPLMKKILQAWLPEWFDEKSLLKMKPLCNSISELTGMYEGFQDWIEQFKQIH